MTTQKSDDLYTCPVCNNQFPAHVDEKETMFCPFCGSYCSGKVISDLATVESKEEKEMDTETNETNTKTKEEIINETKEEIKEEIINETKEEENIETKEEENTETKEINKEAEAENKEENAESKEEKAIVEPFESNEVADSKLDSFEIKEEKDIQPVLKDDSEKEIYTCPVCKNQFFIHVIDGIKNCPFCGTEIKLNKVPYESNEPKNEIEANPVEIKAENNMQAIPGINLDKPVNQNLYPYQQTQAIPAEAIGTQIAFNEVTEPKIEKSTETEKAPNITEISKEKTEPVVETSSQTDVNTKPKPSKEKHEYDVIIGTILFVIGMIIIMVNLIMSNSVSNQNVEKPQVQMEQTIEPHDIP